MIEYTAHRLADLLSRTACQRFGLAKLARDKRLKPLFNRNSLDGPQLEFSPMRKNPPVQNPSFSVAGRVRLAFLTRISKLVEFVVLYGFCHGDRSQLGWAIRVDVEPQSSEQILQSWAVCVKFCSGIVTRNC